MNLQKRVKSATFDLHKKEVTDMTQKDFSKLIEAPSYTCVTFKISIGISSHINIIIAVNCY